MLGGRTRSALRRIRARLPPLQPEANVEDHMSIGDTESIALVGFLGGVASYLLLAMLRAGVLTGSIGVCADQLSHIQTHPHLAEPSSAKVTSYHRRAQNEVSPPLVSCFTNVPQLLPSALVTNTTTRLCSHQTACRPRPACAPPTVGPFRSAHRVSAPDI